MENRGVEPGKENDGRRRTDRRQQCYVIDSRVIRYRVNTET